MIREQDLRSARHSAPQLAVGLVTTSAQFAELRDEWDELLDSSHAGVFNSWEWLYPWHRRIAPERALRIFTAREAGGRLVGLLPLALEVRNVLGRRVRRLSFLGDTQVGSDYLDLIARPGFEERAAAALGAHLRDLRGVWDVVDLNDLAATTPTVGRLSETLNEGFEAQLSERYICPYEPLRAESFDQLLHRTARRDNYLRRRKWLERQPGFRIDCSERVGQLDGPMSDFFRLHALRWAEDGGSQGIRGPEVEAFHREATGLLAERARLRVYTLRIGDKALASVYGIVHRGVFHYFQSGADPEWRNKSVGLVLVGETFRHSLETGLVEYDFLHGTEPYKFEWVHHQRTTVSLRIFRRQGTGAWMNNAEKLGRRVRNGIKLALPERWVERIRIARRQRLSESKQRQ